MKYAEVQNIAKETIKYIKSVIKPGMSLRQVRKICEDKMMELGADSFWYWDIGAFCFCGNETVKSVSGKVYQTSDKIIQENDIVTIDLSPQNVDIWGDYARTVIIENGIIINDVNCISNSEWKNGLLMEDKLHSEMKNHIGENTTFEELYFYMNDFIKDNGYINLDFMGNLGHSIAKAKNDRIYIEKGNKTKLSEAGMFTFEPHISIRDSKYGYKKENIYYFKENQLVEL